MSPNWRTALLLVFASLFLVGAKCTVVASSGSGSSSGGRAVVKTSSGHFSGCSNHCVRFSTGSKHGYTGRRGRYSYRTGARIRFFIGDLQLGEEVKARDLMTAADLFKDRSTDARTATNVARLLMSLDATPADVHVSIPRDVHRIVVLSNPLLTDAIRSMDFADETAFVNAASQILAVGAEAYTFTPSLVDEERARQWLAGFP